MIKKKEKIYLFILFIIVSSIIVYSLVNNNYFINYEIPEYFRNLFYDNHTLFPSFAYGINGGENIFNYSYYGLYSPILFLSFLFPFVSMKLFLIIVNIITSVGSIVLFYYLLRTNKYSEKISFIGSLSLIILLPLFDSINILFIILSFIGIDIYFKNNKKTLLMISIYLSTIVNTNNFILTIITILIFFIYKYLINNIKFNLKNIINSLLTISLPILACSYLLIPTICSQLNIFSLTIINSLTAYKLFPLILVCVIVIFTKGKREDLFLSISLIILIIFQIGNMISLIPLICYAINVSIDRITKNTIDKRLIFTNIVVMIILMIINNIINSIYSFISIIIVLIILEIFERTKKNKYSFIIIVIYLLCYYFNKCNYQIFKNDYIFENQTFSSYTKTFNKKEFDGYDYPYTEEILINNVVTSNSDNKEYESHIVESYIKASDIKYIAPTINRDGYVFDVRKDNSIMIINIPNYMLDKVIFISFDLDSNNKIKINNSYGINNKYRIYKKGLTSVEVVFNKSKYDIKNFKIYYTDYKYFNDDLINKIDISSSVNVLEKYYVVTNTIYDKNIIVEADNKKINSEKVNNNYLGFIIKEGKHKINIYYKNKSFIAGIIVSLFSIISIVFLCIKKRN